MHGLSQAGVELDRKVLADIAVRDPETFRRFAETRPGGGRCLIHRPTPDIIPGAPSEAPCFVPGPNCDHLIRQQPAQDDPQARPAQLA